MEAKGSGGEGGAEMRGLDIGEVSCLDEEVVGRGSKAEGNKMLSSLSLHVLVESCLLLSPLLPNGHQRKRKHDSGSPPGKLDLPLRLASQKSLKN